MFSKRLPATVSSKRPRQLSKEGLSSQVDSQAIPPDGASPAMVARLTDHSTAVPATLLHLAQRGLVRIEATPDSRPQSKQFTLYPQAAAQAQLNSYEQLLLDVVVQTSDSVALSAVAPRLAWAADQLDAALETEMTAAGWLDPERRQQRNQQLALSVLTALLGAAVLIAGLVLGGAALGGLLAAALSQAGGVLAILLLGGGLALLALSLFARRRASALSPLSEQGELAAGQWKAFAAYLRGELQGRAPEPRGEHFDQYLPLAAALGLAKDLGRHFQKQGGTLSPAWLKPLTATGHAGDFGAIASLLTVADSDQ
jgi:hypothetical protein